MHVIIVMGAGLRTGFHSWNCITVLEIGNRRVPAILYKCHRAASPQALLHLDQSRGVNLWRPAHFVDPFDAA